MRALMRACETRGPIGFLLALRHILTLWVRPQLLVFLSVSITPAIAAQPSQSLPCIPAAPTDSAPWESNARILASFPADNPAPRFLGGFADANSEYELHLWRDSNGVFGELLWPVLEADSPTSRLYDGRFNGTSGAVGFTVRFQEGEWQFNGALRNNSVVGTFKSARRSQALVLRKLRANRMHGALDQNSYTSRAQFDCAAILFRRY